MMTHRTHRLALLTLLIWGAFLAGTGHAGRVSLHQYIYGLQSNQPLIWQFTEAAPHRHGGGILSFFWTLDNIPDGAFVPVTIDIDGMFSVDYLESTPHPWDYTDIAVGDPEGGFAIRYWFEFNLDLSAALVKAILADGNLEITVSSMGVTDPDYSINPTVYPQNGVTLDRARAMITYNIGEPESLLLLVPGLLALGVLAWRNAGIPSGPNRRKDRQW